MLLLIVRHAIALPRGTPGVADDDRPLTERGIERFHAAAAGLARIVDPPDVVLTSPLKRAKETALIASGAWSGSAGKSRAGAGAAKVTRAERPREAGCLAGGSVGEVLAEISKHSSKSCVALFGHEPQLSELLAALVGSRRSDSLELKKGGAALVEIEGEAREGGRLIWLLPPRILRRLAE